MTEQEEKYPDFIMQAVRQNLGLEEDDTSLDDSINQMPKRTVLDRYLEWNCLVGYAGTVLSAIDAIYYTNLQEDES